MSSIQVPDSPDELIKTWTWSRVPPPRAGEDLVGIPIHLYLHERLLDVSERCAAESGRPVRLRDMVETALWNYLESGACWGL